MNNTEGLRCLEIAEDALKKGDLFLAERLSKKALRMLSPQDCQSDYIRCQQIYNQAVQASREKNNMPSTSQPATHQTRFTKPKNVTSSSPKSTLTKLEEKCRRIVESKDYYDILNVSRHADTEEIKKAYRKLALQLHPDKAKCASAEAAFKVIAKAYQCLSDPESRRHFDTYGVDKDAQTQSQSPHATSMYDSHFMSAEELFASFFGVQFTHRQPGVRTRVYRVQRNTSQASTSHTNESHSSHGLLQILPLLIIIFMSIISNLFTSSSIPAFSFTRSSDYSIARTTTNFKLPYYVKSNFYRSYPENSETLRDLEHQMELNYFSSECNREKQPLLEQLQRLQFYGTSFQYNKKAEEIRQLVQKSSNCRNYRKAQASRLH